MYDEGKTSLFGNVKFVIAQCNNTEEIKTLLIEGGAKHINYLSEHVTLVIADNNCPEAEEAVDLYDKPVVKSLWVYQSLKVNKLLPFEAFSPMKTIFTNVVASFSSNLSKRDIDILSSTLTFYGAKVSKDFKNSTHHIVASADDSDKLPEYELIGKKIIAPDWVIESVEHQTCCDEQLYDPNLLLPKPPTPPPPPPPQQTTVPAAAPLSRPTTATNPVTSQTNLSPSPKSQNKSHEKKSQPIIPAIQNKSGNLHNNINLQQKTNIVQHQQPRPQNPQVIRPQHHNDHQMPNLQQMTSQQQYYQKQYPQQNYQPNSQQQNVVIRQPTSLSNHVQSGPMQVANVRPQYRPNFVNTNTVPNQVRPPQNLYNQQQRQTTTHIQQHQEHVTIQQPQYHVQHQQPVMQQQQQYYARPQQSNFVSPSTQMQVTHMQQPTTQPPHLIHAGQTQTMGPLQSRPQFQNNIVGQVPQQMNTMGPRTFYGQKQGSPALHHPQDSMPNNQQYVLNQQQQSHIQVQQPIQQHPPQQIQQQQPQPPQQYYPRQQYPAQNFSQSPITNQNPNHLQQGLNQIPPTTINPIRAQFQPNTASIAPGQMQPVRVARNLFYSPNQDSRPQTNIRAVSPARVPTYPISNPRMQTTPPSGNNQSQIHTQTQQPQPHPSIFDDTQESNLAQIKAKVPIVEEKIEYFGYETKGSVPKNLPLLGCKFKFADYDGVDSRKKESWLESIKCAGGIFADKIEDTTHLICENRLSDSFKEAVKNNVRCVTIYWVNDVLARNQLTYPWKALHLPLPFNKCGRPLTHNHLITVTNFRGKQRREIIDMIKITGARYTESFSTHNTLIVCANMGGDKYAHAVEWKTPIVNCQFINDILLNGYNDISSLIALTKYKLFDSGDALKLKSYSDVKSLMNPWMKPISTGDHSSILNGENHVKPFPPSITSEDSGIVTVDNNCTTVDIKKESSGYRKRKSTEPVRLLFTHLSASLVAKLKSYALDLGIGFASSYANCTHLIVDRISRTPRFICAFSHAKYILNYRWLIESHNANQLLDERQFILQDKSGEEQFSFDLVYSLLKRKKLKGLLFNNMIFFITPSVMLNVTDVKEMIESAGGVVSTKKVPSKLQLEQMTSDQKRLVVVTCEEDLYLCTSMEPYGVDIVNVEFVLSGILRQDIDYNAHRIKVSVSQPAKKLKDT